MAVMNVARGTKAFSPAQQTSPQKSDGPANVAAGEFKKTFGEQSVGEVANKIADPNYIDPSKKVRGTGSSELGKDAFMKLMLAQMKNQDPTQPLQSHEMAAQLAQFTSLEQLSNVNTNLEAIKEQNSPRSNFQAIAFIGKHVSGDGAKVSRVAGDTKHAFNFDMLGDAARVSVKIKDAKGDVVRKLELGQLRKGANSVTWDGLKDDGTSARAGEYRMELEAKSSNGQKIATKTAFSGKITGLNYTPEGPILLVGTQTVRLSEVKKIEDAPPGEAMPMGAMAPSSPMPAPMGLSALGNASTTMPSAGAVAALAQAQAQQAAPQAEVPVQASPTVNSQMSQQPTLQSVQQPAVQEIQQGASQLAKEPERELPPAPEAEVKDSGLENVAMSGALAKKVAREL